MKSALTWLKVVLLACGLLVGSTAYAVEYLSGIWAIPTTGQLGDRLYNITRQACESTCTNNQSCSGFYAFTDWNTCQLYGPEADLAPREGPWSNVQMNWKKANPDPLQGYNAAFAPVPNNGALTETLYGYPAQQCAKMCTGKKDCISFHAFTDANICRLYGLDATWSSTNGPWSNVKMYTKPTQPAILMVDVHVLSNSSGANAGWTKEYVQKVLAKATQEMNDGQVVYSLGSYDRIVNDTLYNGRELYPILLAYGNTTRPGRTTIYVAGPMNSPTGLAWVGVTLAPYAVISSRSNAFDAADILDNARVFLHELGHNQGFAHNSPTGGTFDRYPYATDWYWSDSPLARQVFVRLAAWSKLYQQGIDTRSKNAYNCVVGAQLPDRGTFPAPNVPAATSQECAARCTQSTGCVAFYAFTDAPTCVLFDASSIGHDTQQGWSNVEMCRRK